MNQITFQDVYQTSATSNPFKLGQRGQTPDGRQWVFVKASTGTLAKGSVAIQDAVVAVDNVSSSTDALGRIVYITKASAGWTVGAYEDTWVVVDDGTGKGQAGKVQTNSTDTLTLYPENAFATALSVADSDITIVRASYVTKAAVTSTIQGAVGIAQVAFANGDFGWLLTEGDGVVLTGNTLVVGAGFNTGDDTTGQVIVAVTAKGPFDAQNLGFCWVANSAADMLALVRAEVRG
jgi:hypothetical protein